MNNDSFTSKFINGATAGGTAVFFSHPFELLKARLQVQGELAKHGTYKQHYSGLFSIFKDLRTVYSHDGFRGLYKGISTGIPYQIMLNGTRLGIDSMMKEFYDPKEQPFFRASVAAGAGAAGAFIGNPLFVIKTRLQIKSNLSEVGYQHEQTKLTLKECLSGWNFKNSTVRAAMTRVAVGSTVQLCSYDLIKFKVEKLYDRRSLENSFYYLMLVSFPASILVTFPLVTLMAPFDTIYTRVCNQPPGRYKGNFDVVKSTWKSEGLAGFYKGAIAIGMRLGIQSSITMFVLDMMTRRQGLLDLLSS